MTRTVYWNRSSSTTWITLTLQNTRTENVSRQASGLSGQLSFSEGQSGDYDNSPLWAYQNKSS